VRQTVNRQVSPWLSVSDANVVDDRLVLAEDIGLLDDLLHARNARQIADDHVHRGWYLLSCVVGPCVVAGMQRDFVAAFDKQAARHEAEAI
jgi:hypothetical protein